MGMLSGAVAGLALDQAIPLNRVWSFPKEIIVPKNVFDYTDHYKRALNSYVNNYQRFPFVRDGDNVWMGPVTYEFDVDIPNRKSLYRVNGGPWPSVPDWQAKESSVSQHLSCATPELRAVPRSQSVIL